MSVRKTVVAASARMTVVAASVRKTVVAAALVFATAVSAQQSAPTPPAAPRSPEAVERLHKLSSELRCLVCQNQTLADSNADLAVDLRRQVEGMIDRGESDDRIKTYLVERYGDFVLYRPPVQRNTAFLWFGPFALLLLGAVAWILVQRRSRRAASATPAESDAQRERARHLLED